MTAVEQLNRIGALVAELTRRERSGDPPATLDELAERYRTTAAQIQADIRVLTQLDDSADRDWLLSLRAAQAEDGVTLWSGGPFRRPIRFAADECLALAAGLATEPDGTSVSADFREGLVPHELSATPIAVEPGAAGPAGETVRSAIDADRCLWLRYAGDGGRTVTERVVHPHDLVTARGRSFLIAWCDLRNDWRRFRVDRMLTARRLDTPLLRREPVPDRLFVAPEDGVDEVRVRYRPPAARWLAERFPAAQPGPDGTVEVTYRVANMSWMIREVLQYGDAAEILQPVAYREAMRGAVSGSGPTGSRS